MRVSTMFKLFYGILLSSVLTFAAVGVPWVDPDDVNADPPAVQTSGAVVLNRWTNQYADALAVSKTLGRPVLLAIATSKRTCTECKKWYKAMENPAWAKWLARHPMVLVFINYMSDRALYDEYHSLFKGEPSDTWPTLAILESGSSPTSPTILAKLDDEPDKKSIYPNCAKFTEWLGEYVYGYESTTVAFGDPPAAVVHEVRAHRLHQEVGVHDVFEEARLVEHAADLQEHGTLLALAGAGFEERVAQLRDFLHAQFRPVRRRRRLVREAPADGKGQRRGGHGERAPSRPRRGCHSFTLVWMPSHTSLPVQRLWMAMRRR